MLTKSQVLEALKYVKDPELHKSIVDLNMVKKIEMHGTSISIKIALTISGCPLKAKIQQAIETTLKNIGASHVSLTFGEITPEERQFLIHTLKNEVTMETGMPKNEIKGKRLGQN